MEGFFVLFRPYDSQESYKKHTIPGPLVRNYVIDNLEPDTPYSIRMQSFNTAGESEISNTVAKKTLCKFKSKNFCCSKKGL